HYAGSTYVVLGKAGGFAAAASLRDLDGSNGFRIDGIAAPQISGEAARSGGDINGDGYDDILIGAPQFVGTTPGDAYVVYGKPGGFGASIDLAHIHGSAGFHIPGIEGNGGFGTTISTAGDLNGDG